MPDELKSIEGRWITFELAKEKFNIELSQVNPDCIDWNKRMIFIGRIYDEAR